jgi:hypothetical protein
MGVRVRWGGLSQTVVSTRDHVLVRVIILRLLSVVDPSQSTAQVEWNRRIGQIEGVFVMMGGAGLFVICLRVLAIFFVMVLV